MALKQVITLLYSSVLLACAASGQSDDDDYYADSGRRSDCISVGTIRDYRVLDDSNLIVTASGKRKYHTVLSRRAFGLQSSWRLGFVDASGRICPGFSDILVDQGFGPEKINIRSIRLISADDEEMLLIQFGLKKPEHVQPREKEEVKGAGVEELD